MKNIDTERNIFLKFGDFLQRKGHADKEMDSRQIKKMEETNSIFLTFDFCPTKEVDRPVIDWLIKNKIKATFFINAKWISLNSDKDLSFMDNPLFTIGGHGFKHIDPLEQSDEQEEKDIDECLRFWKDNKKEIKWYRVPYGHPTDVAMQKFHKEGIRCASWSGPVLDKKAPHLEKNTSKKAIDYIENRLQKGEILIAHANGEGINTLEIIKILKKVVDSKGWSFDNLK